jgi:hypothetical protein
MIGRVIILLLAFTCSAVARADSFEAKPIRILFIGNSYVYYHDLPQLLRKVAAASGVSRPVETEAVTFAGASLEMHWNSAKSHAYLTNKKWDYVVLQEQSTLPITDPEKVHRYIRLFDEEIRRAGAKTVLYLTWAHATAPETQAVLNKTYRSIAQEIGARVAPVGPAWAIALRESPALALYDSDNSHPKIAGSYLAAYVFHFVLFNKAPRMAHAPAGMTDTELAVLLKAAETSMQSAVSGLRAR